MSDQLSTIALLGFPRTGKSTYLGALWQIIQDPAEPTIVEQDLTGDRSYLQSLGDQVARGKVIDRTETSSTEGMQLTLGFEEGAIRIHIPDLSGETLSLLVESRVWHPRLLDTIAASNAMLLFLHPEELCLPMAIGMAEEILSGRQLSPVTDSPRSANDQDAKRTSEHQLSKFRTESACTAAKCIDALENVLTYQRKRWPIRLAIIISAWDTVDGSPTPASWLKENVPALDSFARANTDMIQWNLYGVSAQGGKLPKQRDKLLKLGNVRNRVYAHNSSGARVPITDPLHWALWK